MNEQKVLSDLFDKLRNEKVEFGVSSCALIIGDADSCMHDIVEKNTSSHHLVSDGSKMKIPVFQCKLNRVSTDEDDTSDTKKQILTARTVLESAVINLLKVIEQRGSLGCHPGLVSTKGSMAEKYQMFVQLTK